MAGIVVSITVVGIGVSCAQVPQESVELSHARPRPRSSASRNDAITPDVTAIATYEKLVAVVKEASRLNIAQAELRALMGGMGDVAVAIARPCRRWPPW